METEIAEKEKKKRKATLELITLGNASIESSLSSTKIKRDEILKSLIKYFALGVINNYYISVFNLIARLIVQLFTL